MSPVGTCLLEPEEMATGFPGGGAAGEFRTHGRVGAGVGIMFRNDPECPQLQYGAALQSGVVRWLGYAYCFRETTGVARSDGRLRPNFPERTSGR